jgi:probable HAF family extracellular repeat protein
MPNLISLLLVIGLAAALPAAAFEVRTIDFPGAADTNLIAVNDLGQFVGTEQDGSNAQHAIFFDGKKLKLLDPQGLIGSSPQSFALSINNRGAIAGVYEDSGGGFHGFLRQPNGKVDSIDYPGASITEAFGVNDFGTVIGLFFDAAGNVHAFTLRDGRFQLADLPGGLQTIPFSINDRGQIVGEFITTPNTHGFGYLEQPDKQVTFTTAPNSQPQGTFFISINNRDQVLGAYTDQSGAVQNFLRTGDDYALFNLPERLGASGVSAQTVNDLGDIVGFYSDGNGVQHGFFATPSRRDER